MAHYKKFQFFNITVQRYTTLNSVHTSLATPLTLHLNVTYDNITYSPDGAKTSFTKNLTYYYQDPITFQILNSKELYRSCTRNFIGDLSSSELAVNSGKLHGKKPQKCRLVLLNTKKGMTKGYCGVNYKNSFCSDNLRPNCSFIGKCVNKNDYDVELEKRPLLNVKQIQIALTNESYGYKNYPRDCKIWNYSSGQKKRKIDKVPSECKQDQLTIYQVRPGLSRACKTIEERPGSDAFVQMLYRLYLDVSDNILINYFNAKIYYSENFSYSQFTRNMTKLGIQKSIQSQLWFDDSYGWSELDSFNNWIMISHDPILKKKLKASLTNHFGLSESQMESLIGAGSWLKQTIDKSNSDISTKFSKTCGKDICNGKDLAQIQWTSKNVTIDIDNLHIIHSYASINQSIIAPYEVPIDRKDKGISYGLGKKLLAYDEQHEKELNVTTTLLNFVNARYLADNLSNPKNIQSYFQLADFSDAVSLKKYYETFIAYIESYTNNRKLSETKLMKSRYARDGILESIDQLQLYVQNNVTMKAFNDFFRRHVDEYNCQDYFTYTSNNNNLIRDKICQNPKLMLYNYQAIVKWIEAWLSPDSTYPHVTENAQKFIIDQINLPKYISNWGQLKGYMDLSLFSLTITDIIEQMSSWYGCLKILGGCTRKYLAEVQYFTGNITDISYNKTAIKQFSSLNVKSIAKWDENQSILKNKIPEFYGFANIHYNFTKTQFGLPMDIVYNYGKKSILNDQVIYRMTTFSEEQRTADLAHQFNIWCDPIVITTYFDHVFYEWFLGGFFAEQNMADIIYGYNDMNLIKLKNKPALKGGQDIKVDIQVLFAKDSLVPMTLKTGKQPMANNGFEKGSKTQANRSEATKMMHPDRFETQKFVTIETEFLMNRSLIESYNNTASISYNGKDTWKQPVMINGTDWYSTKPFNYVDNIDVYNQEIFQNANFWLNKTISSYQFDLNKFKWNNDNFKANYPVYRNRFGGTWNLTRLYRLPYIVTLPFFREVDEDFKPWIEKVQYGAKNESILNTKDEQIFQDSVLSEDQDGIYPYFYTEIFSGFAFNYSLPYQVTPPDFF